MTINKSHAAHVHSSGFLSPFCPYLGSTLPEALKSAWMAQAERFSSSPTASAPTSRFGSAHAAGAAPDLRGSKGAGAVKKVLTMVI